MSVGKIFKFHNDLDTDQIIASQYLLLPTIDEMKDHTFESLDPDFPKKVKPGDYVVGGENFGCGSSREQAPSVLKALGVQAVVAKSFARIHQANLVNAGILPLTFENEADYDTIDQMDELVLPDIRSIVEKGGQAILENKTKGTKMKVNCQLSDRQRAMMLAGGLLNYTREQA